MTSPRSGPADGAEAQVVDGSVNWLQEAAVALATGVVLVLVGAPIGLAWGWLSPHLDIPAVIGGSESAFAVQFDQDLILLALGVVVGLAAGVATARWARGHDLGAAVGLAVGGVLAGLIAAVVGHRYRMPALLHFIKPGLDAQTRAQTVALIGFRLRIGAFALAIPVVGLLTLVSRVLFTGRQSARQGPTTDAHALRSLAEPAGSAREPAPWWSAPR